MCNIRRIQSDDWQKYKALRLEAVRLHSEAFSTTYADQLAKTDADWQMRVLDCAIAPDNVLLVADNQCQLVGMMGLYRESGKQSHVVMVWGVYVQADYRRQQLSCQLMQETLAWVWRMEGVRKVRLEVNAVNTPAYKLYLRNGFTETGRLREELNVEGQYCDLIQMELFL